jgi:hypothetical protein
MKKMMKLNISMFLILLFSVFAATDSFSHEGSFRTYFEPASNQDGYAITLAGEWTVETLMGEATRNIHFNWDLTEDNDPVSMQFIPYGKDDIVNVDVPAQIAKKSKPISINLKARLSSLAGGSIDFDGGAIMRGDNHNVTGSPAWTKLFKQNNNYIPENRAKKIMGAGFELDFGYFSHDVTFALADIKLWYDKNQRSAFGHTACQKLTSLYRELSNISSKYKARHQKMVDLCQAPERVDIKRMKKELEYLKKKKISEEFLSSAQNIEINQNLNEGVRAIEGRLADIGSSELSIAETESKYSAEKEAEQQAESQIRLIAQEGKARLSGLKDSYEAGFKPLFLLLNNTSLPPCLSAFRCRERRDVDLSGSVITYERRRKISDSYSSKTELDWGRFDICSDLNTSIDISLVFNDTIMTGKTIFKDGRESAEIDSKVLDVGDLSKEELRDAVYHAKKQCGYNR